MSFNDDESTVGIEIHGVSAGDERVGKKFAATRLSIKEARVLADDKELEEAKDIIVQVQSSLHDEDPNLPEDEVDELKANLQRLLKLMKTQETYEKHGRVFALSLETSHDPHHLAARGNEGPSSGTGRTKIRIITKREAPLEKSKFNVKLELTCNDETPGLDLVTVLDISGSMLGEKLEKMKSAMQLVIKKLRPIDRLSIVTFSSHSNTLCPLHHMTEDSKAGTEKLVNGLVAGGGTIIAAGLEKGLQELKDGCLTSRRWAIMLLCDGEQGPRDPDAAEVEVGNVPVYTFGLGSNYDPVLLKTIANKSSRGMFTDVQDVDKLTEEFSKCLDGLFRSVVQDLQVTITQENSTNIENVSAENYSQYRDDIGSVIVLMGDLYEKEIRNIIVDLLLPDVSITQCADILRIRCTYSFGREPIHTTPLFVTITRRKSTPMIDEARVVTDKQLEIANKMIIEAQKLLQNVADETLNSEVQQLKRLMNSQKLYDEQETEEVTIDENHLPTAESGEGTIRSSPLGQASTVQSYNDVKKYPIAFLLDRTVVRQRIPQPLKEKSNYADWSKKVKKDLEELNLWKVIEEAPIETTESIKNVDMGTTIKKLRQFRENWMALILINQACGFPINLQIIDLYSAKEAWETLATNWQQGGSDAESFLSAGEHGDWKKAERLLDSNCELATARIPSSQNTVLHLASLAGEVNIVKKLVALMRPEDLEIQDKHGYTALAKASINGDTRIAKYMFHKNPRLVSIPTARKLLPVVIAVMNGHKQMTSYLCTVTPQKDLTNEDNKGNINGATLLTYSIRMQFYDICFALIQKCPRLAVTLDHNGQSALYQLACTPFAFRGSSKLKLWQQWIYNCVHIQDIHCDSNETRLSVPDEHVSQNNPDEHVSQSNPNEDVSQSNPDEDFQSNCWNARYRGIWQQIKSRHRRVLGIWQQIKSRPLRVLGIWQQIKSRLLRVLDIDLGIKHIYEMKLVHHQSPKLLDLICEQIEDLDVDEINSINNALHEAAARGVLEFIVGVLKKFPDFRWRRDKEGSTIFMKAVQFRQADVFSLIHRFPSKDKMMAAVDKCGENTLHKLEYSSVDKISTIQGGLIKMQKELQWREEIKSMMPPDRFKKQNHKNKTAQQVFDESHGELMKSAEKEMKDIANSCIIVGILVVTIMFAAAFTIPGGNNQDTGFPLFLKKKQFKIFIISDIVSLCFSTVSVLMFLGILTSRYAEKDFLEPLSRKMIIGLSTLFISITAMMIAFTATLFVMLHTELWISLPITVLLASFPVIFCALLFFPLISGYFMSTYGPSIFKWKSSHL